MTQFFQGSETEKRQENGILNYKVSKKFPAARAQRSETSNLKSCRSTALAAVMQPGAFCQLTSLVISPLSVPPFMIVPDNQSGLLTTEVDVQGVRGVDFVYLTLNDLGVEELLLAQRQQITGGGQAELERLRSGL